MTINTDRALGAVLGSAAGDALGASYEFQPAVLPPTPIAWRAGGAGPWERGEWTDDTAMAIPLLDELAAGADLRTDAALGRVVLRWLDWSKGAKDVGIQTRRVFGALERQLERQSFGAGADDTTADTAHVARLCKVAAGQIHDVTGRSGGNGSLMRTGPVALGYLGDEGSGGAEATAAAARAQSDLTHFDADTGDACVLWSLAIRHAILTGEIDLYAQLSALPADRAEIWRGRIKDAEGLEPHQIKNNGWVAAAFQAAWSAIVRGSSLVDVLERAVRAGDDTDTVAAIAGSLAGAKYGASALPKLWTDELHGWPSERAADLEAKVLLVVRRE
ncbi:ADP-ribosyl-[dinitrogen reductase] glycohydrolase [Vanrija pseudolonga]|uniref:ADP-ribosylhydrolase ARH3 n=1 Tax=Vanrija pseudolonga TaxID=143232 RepID=A0AAF0Y9X9_9TREE|nr:ADP-ribosyl-[dinitrogen reductase] glycohydrolase [Vanrija pseudolonga]